MVSLQNVSYAHPNKDVLFSDINFTITAPANVALIGNNGIGKSTLLQIMAGKLSPSGGRIVTSSSPYYVPQVFGQFDQLTVAEALKTDQKINALRLILQGHLTETNLEVLADDWTIEERSQQALNDWGMAGTDLAQNLGTLSGGQKMRVFLAGLSIHRPEIILLDEPTNHLDMAGRSLLYEFIQTARAILVIVSHDRKLLNLLQTVYELNKDGINMYGGNYDFYTAQKEIENNALNEDLRSIEKSLRKARAIERESIERQEKLNARGRKKQEKSGVPTIMLNTLRNNAEKSSARLKDVHAAKIEGIRSEREELRSGLPGPSQMRLGFDNARIHKGKMLFESKELNYRFGKKWLWPQPLNVAVRSGERIAVAGTNGSGKTTLIKLILGQLEPDGCIVHRAISDAVYIDQDYSLIDESLTVFEQAAQFNQSALQEHEIGIRLTRFLFTKAFWSKPCSTLSGGEKMRLILCCLTIRHTAPDMIILDEPTNNLDILNIEILTAAMNEYEGTLIVVSHDEYFLTEIKVNKTIDLDLPGPFTS